MRSVKSLVAVGLMAGTAVAALADEPDILEFLKKVDATTKGVTTVSYEVKSWGEGGLEVRLPKVRGTLVARQKKGSDFPYMRTEAKVTKPGIGDSVDRSLITDGKLVWTRYQDGDSIAENVEELPSSMILRMEPIDRVWMQEFLHASPFSDEINAAVQKYEGKKKIGDTECHVIYIEYARGQGKARWYFGVEDALPHRVDRLMDEGTFVMEVTKVNTSPKIDDETFKIEKPGDAEKKAEKHDHGDDHDHDHDDD